LSLEKRLDSAVTGKQEKILSEHVEVLPEFLGMTDMDCTGIRSTLKSVFFASFYEANLLMYKC